MDWIGDRMRLHYFNLLTSPGALFDRLGNNVHVYPSIARASVWTKIYVYRLRYRHRLTLSTASHCNADYYWLIWLQYLSVFCSRTICLRMGSNANGCQHSNENGMGRRHNLDERYEISIQCKCLDSSFFSFFPGHKLALYTHFACDTDSYLGFFTCPIYAPMSCVFFFPVSHRSCRFYS